jgi:hypothetical protein
MILRKALLPCTSIICIVQKFDLVIPEIGTDRINNHHQKNSRGHVIENTQGNLLAKLIALKIGNKARPIMVG